MHHSEAMTAQVARVYVTGCAPYEVVGNGIWRIALHRRVLFFLAVLGIILSAVLVPSRLAIVLLLTPLSVTATAALFCRIHSIIAPKVKWTWFGYDGQVVHTRWIAMLAISLFLNISVVLTLMGLHFGVDIHFGIYLWTPLFWTAVSEFFSVFAVNSLLAPAGVLKFVNPTNPQHIHMASNTNFAANAEDDFGAQTGPAMPDNSHSMPWQVHLGQTNLNLKDPLILRAEGNYVEVTDESGGRLVRTTLSSALAKIRPDAGLQIHRSYWISFPACERLESDGQELYLHTSLGERLKVAKPRQAHILGQFERRNQVGAA